MFFDKIIQFRLTSNEFKQLKHISNRLQITQSQFIRQAILWYMNKKKFQDVELV